VWRPELGVGFCFAVRGEQGVAAGVGEGGLGVERLEILRDFSFVRPAGTEFFWYGGGFFSAVVCYGGSGLLVDQFFDYWPSD